MSACIYYRKGRCSNGQRCQYKMLTLRGDKLCQKSGDLPDVDKSSEHFRKVQE